MEEAAAISRFRPYIVFEFGAVWVVALTLAVVWMLPANFSFEVKIEDLLLLVPILPAGAMIAGSTALFAAFSRFIAGRRAILSETILTFLFAVLLVLCSRLGLFGGDEFYQSSLGIFVIAPLSVVVARLIKIMCPVCSRYE